MSLVGTRPPTVDEWDKYELHHRARLATKPGLTGMWQVSGRSNITDLYVDSKYEVAVNTSSLHPQEENLVFAKMPSEQELRRKYTLSMHASPVHIFISDSIFYVKKINY